MAKVYQAVASNGVAFTRVARPNFDRDVGGSSLWFHMPECRHERVKQLFGTSLAPQRKKKYSESIVLRSTTGQTYTLYMSYGVWRIGARKPNAFDEVALKELLTA